MSISQNTLKGLYRKKEKSKNLGQFMENLRNSHINSGWFVKTDNKEKWIATEFKKFGVLKKETLVSED